MNAQNKEYQKDKLTKNDKTTGLKGTNVPPETFIKWVQNIMKQEKFYYAQPQDVATELARIHGGLVSQHLNRIYQMRIKVSNYRKEIF